MINERILAMIPGVADSALSLDEALDCNVKHYPVEFVNTISVSGLPEHVLTLKKGVLEKPVVIEVVWLLL